MTKNILLSILVVTILTSGYYLWKSKAFVSNKPVICTMETKLCPDGSYVARTGPKCEFSDCPTTPLTTTTITKKESGYLTGKVSLSPTCPVERIPPDPACAPKPYPTLLTVRSPQSSLQVRTDSSGVFRMHLLPGIYTITIDVSSLYPRCQSTQVVIKANSTTSADISCDTGIR